MDISNITFVYYRSTLKPSPKDDHIHSKRRISKVAEEAIPSPVGYKLVQLPENQTSKSSDRTATMTKAEIAGDDQPQLVSASNSCRPSCSTELTTAGNETLHISVPGEVMRRLQDEIAVLKREVIVNKTEMNKTIQRIENKSSQDLNTVQEQLQNKEQGIGSLSNNMEDMSRSMKQNLTLLTKELQQSREESVEVRGEVANLKETIQHQSDELATAHYQITTLQQREVEMTQKVDTLSERLQQKDEQLVTMNEELATLQQRLQQNEIHLAEENAALTERIQAQETQQQALCNDAIQQMRRQINTEVRQQVQQITQQMNIMHKLFNTVKPQWLITRCEVRLGQHELGNGGWGRVVEATFRGEQVAAKCLHNQIISDYNIQLFVREMQISSKCHHPNLLKFLGASLEGDPIILTELMQTNLHDIIQQHELKDHQIFPVSHDIASAIDYLHSLSPEPIIHRDISSSNVLLRGPVGRKWVTKLSDFGSANFRWHTNERSRAPGNPTYAAPEVLSPHSHSEKMDVYSFGVLIFEMCSGQVPALQVRNQLLPTAATVWPDPQCHYVPLIVACTRENKDDRPTMREVLNNL